MSVANFKSSPISAREFLGKHPQPVVIHFQPSEFSILKAPEDLKLWEELLVSRVGLKAAVASAIVHSIEGNGGTCCESGSTNDCDQD
jgi:hypothetical protein